MRPHPRLTKGYNEEYLSGLFRGGRIRHRATRRRVRTWRKRDAASEILSALAVTARRV